MSTNEVFESKEREEMEFLNKRFAERRLEESLRDKNAPMPQWMIDEREASRKRVNDAIKEAEKVLRDARIAE